jgi:multiple sugar transport system substrate-binding protein
VQPRRRRVRRGAFAGAAVLLCLLSACTTGRTPSPPASSSASPTASRSGPVTLRFSVYGGQAEVEAYRAVAKAYTRQKPQVTVTVQAVRTLAQAGAALRRELAAGDPPDLFVTNATALPELMERGAVQPVDQLLEKRGVQFGDNYQRLGLEAFSAEDALQCMPNDVSPHVVFYNRRLFSRVRLAEPGQPSLTPQTGWSWATFVRAAQQLSHGRVKGVYLPPDLTTLTPLLRSAGTDIVDDPQKPTTLQLADGTTRAALEKILALVRNARLTPATQLTKHQALARFEHGRLGMMVGTRALVPQLRSNPALRFDVFPLPSLGHSQTIADVTGYCLSRASRHPAEAADFLTFASGDQGAGLTAVSGGVVPANLAALHSPSFEQPGHFPLNVLVFSQVMRRADTMPDPPAWPRVVAVTRPLLDRLWYAPVLDLDTLLPRIDALSAALLAAPTPSPSPTGSASGSPSASSSTSP